MTLIESLVQFIGTENYYRWNVVFPNTLLTDGTKYLAENAKCYWLMDAAASHLVGHTDTFSVVRLKKIGSKWKLSLDDGNGNVFVEQMIEYSDFPFDEFKFYACQSGEHLVLMLCSEY